MLLTKMPVKQTFTQVGRELSYVGHCSLCTTRTARNEGFRSLKPVGQHVLEIPTDEQVDLILESATDAHRLTFALMSDAGLRPNEVRALRCKNVQLKWENGEAIGGFITIREGRSYGEIHTPKTGQREIPISRALAKLLAPVIACRSRDQHVALSDRGKPWSQWGIDSAFGRVSQRAGVEGS